MSTAESRRCLLDDEGIPVVLERARNLGHVVCRIDEAGCGALAGPVVAAAVIFTGPVPAGLGDSKVTRDRIMEALESKYPGYGFAKGAGYGSPAHLAKLVEIGACPEHRKTFARVAAAIEAAAARC